MIKEKMKEGTLRIADILRSPRETLTLLMELEDNKIVPKIERDKVYLYKKSGEAILTEPTPFSFDLEKRFRSMMDSNEALYDFLALLGDSYVNQEVISLIMSLIGSLEKAVGENYDLREKCDALKEKLKMNYDFDLETPRKKETIQ